MCTFRRSRPWPIRQFEPSYRKHHALQFQLQVPQTQVLGQELRLLAMPAPRQSIVESARWCQYGRRLRMDAELNELLTQLHNHGVRHDADKQNRLDRLRNLEPDSASLLALLVRATGTAKLLELGTSNGYSTVWLADAVRATGGHVVSVEIDPDRSAEASNNLREAGLDSFVELRVDDAAHALAQSQDNEWDMIFLDAERPAYTSYWPDLRRSLRPGGLVAVDNVLSHADQVAEFRTLVSGDDSMTDVIVPTGAGVLLVVKAR